MPTTSQPAPALLQSVLIASQNGVQVYQAVRAADQLIIDLRLTMLNAVAEQDLGQSATSALGQSFNRLFPGEPHSGLFNRYRQVLETKQSVRFEFQTTLPGQVVPNWLDISVVPMEDSIVVSYDNITQSKADADMARLASVQAEAFNSSMSGITVFEPVFDEDGQIDDFRFVMINDAGLRLSGYYTPDDLLGQTLWQIYPATRINGLFDQYVQVYETGKSISGEKYYPEYDTWRSYTIVSVAGGVMITYTDITAYKKLEESSRQQAHFVTEILEATPVAIAVIRAVRSPQRFVGPITDFVVERTNGTFQKNFVPSLAEDDQPLLTALLPQARESGLLSRCILGVELGKPYAFEMPDRTTGQIRWYQVAMTPQKDQLILTLTDISDTHRLQVEHYFQAELLRSINDNTPVGMVLWEAVRDSATGQKITDFCYRMSNRMNSYLTGHPEESLLGKDLLTLFPHFRGTELEMALRDTLETGRTQRILCTYYTGQPNRWLDAQFSRIGDGRSTDAVLMTFMDVTEQHNAQLAQKQQADLFQTVINAQPTGLVLFKPVREQVVEDQPEQIVDFTYELANETELRLVGRTTGELLGQRLRVLFPGEDGHRLFGRLVDVLTTGQNQEFILPFFSGVVQGWFQISLVCHDGQVLFTFLDVTELKRQQEALELANLNLHRSNENLQQFAYVASHDLQEPLRKIQSFGDMLSNKYGSVLDETGQDMIRRMQAGADRMSMLLRDLLAYSRLVTHRASHTCVPLSTIISQVLVDLELKIQETGAQLNIGELPTVTGDHSQLEHLMLNLLSNALKFHRDGIAPCIQVSGRLLPASAIPAGLIVSENPSRCYAEIIVADNGIGFDEKYLDRIFQVFQRLHGKNEFTGSGVGLAICRKVVENHEGGITAHSQPGVGTTFQIYLPGEKCTQSLL